MCLLAEKITQLWANLTSWLLKRIPAFKSKAEIRVGPRKGDDWFTRDTTPTNQPTRNYHSTVAAFHWQIIQTFHHLQCYYQQPLPTTFVFFVHLFLASLIHIPARHCGNRFALIITVKNTTNGQHSSRPTLLLRLPPASRQRQTTQPNPTPAVHPLTILPLPYVTVTAILIVSTIVHNPVSPIHPTQSKPAHRPPTLKAGNLNS